MDPSQGLFLGKITCFQWLAKCLSFRYETQTARQRTVVFDIAERLPKVHLVWVGQILV